MRSLLVLSIALCLGLATAAPVTDLLKALLKRQAEVNAAPAVPASDEIPDWVPSYEEFGAMHAIGVAIVHMTELAKEDPKAVIDFVTAVGEAIPDEKRRTLFKRQAGGKPGRGGNMGPGSQGPPPGHEFMNEIFENGLYETTLKYVNIMGQVLEHSGAILEWTVKGPGCTDCPPLPDDLVAILMELSGEGAQGGRPGPQDSSQGSRPGPQGGAQGSRPGPQGGAQGSRPRPQGGSSNEQGGSSSEQAGSSSEQGGSPAVQGGSDEQERALLKRLLALLAEKK